MDSSGSSGNKKAFAFYISLFTICGLTITGLCLHADLTEIVKSVIELAMVYLAGQSGVDVAHRVFVAPKQVDAEVAAGVAQAKREAQ